MGLSCRSAGGRQPRYWRLKWHYRAGRHSFFRNSVSAYQVAGYGYDNITAYNRAKSALQGQWANPGAQGPSWEGLPGQAVHSAAVQRGQQPTDLVWTHLRWQLDNYASVHCGSADDEL